MVFKRRTPRSYLRIVLEFFYPRGGWTRAARYVIHRLRRLPDPAHKISRGIGAGVFASFTPFYGFHFLISAVLTFLLRGNILAALLATFFGNPITFPIIASMSMSMGTWILGRPHVPLPRVWQAFSSASVELWHNMSAIFTPEVMRWERLADVANEIFLPYLVGGLVPGIVAGLIAHYASYPMILAYQKSRVKRLKARYEKRLEKETARAEKAALRAEARAAKAEARAAKAEAKAEAAGARPGKGARTDPAG